MNSSPGMTRIGVVVLAVVTALIHFSLLFPNIPFILNGLGYLGLVAALYLPIPMLAGRQKLVRRVLIGFTALTIVLWIAFGSRNTIGYVDKLVEIGLLALLVLEDRRS
jgi:hypothetical protein